MSSTMVDLVKLLKAESKKSETTDKKTQDAINALNELDDSQNIGQLKMVADPNASLTGGNYQNIPAVLLKLQEEMTALEKEKLQSSALKQGESMNLALGSGMRTAPLSQQIAYFNIFGLQ